MEKNKIIKNFDKIIWVFFWAVTIIYGAMCLYLFYMQSIQPLDDNNRYFQSDLPYHISMIVDDGWGYSLTAYIYLALIKIALALKIAGGSTTLIAVFLALVSVGTVILTERLLEAVGVETKGIACGGALLLNFLMPFFIKWAGLYRYVSYQAGNIWHNSTYQVMKLCGLACLLVFIKLEQDYYISTGSMAGSSTSGGKSSSGLTLPKWLSFATLLGVTTAIKPSFLTVFAPAFAIRLLWDWLKEKKPFVKVLVFGLSVVPSCIVILVQNFVLFGSDDETGFTISFMETFKLHADHPKITILLSLAFPIVIGICCVKEILKDKTYRFSIIMAAVGFAEAILLVETGRRSRDGNFLWGYSIALSWLYLMSFKKWYQLAQEKKWVRFGICSAVLLYQFVCGVIFFARLMQGETYFMYG